MFANAINMTAVNSLMEKMSLSELKAFAKAIGVKSEEDYPDWYGIPGVKCIYHNSWADPEILYKGRRCSAYDVEDIMWADFTEEIGIDDPEQFPVYMKKNRKKVLSLCEMVLFPAVH